MSGLSIGSIEPYGDSAFLVRFEGELTDEHLRSMITFAFLARQLDGVLDASSGHRTVIIECGPVLNEPVLNDQLRGGLMRCAEKATPVEGRSIEALAHYDGDDIGWVAQQCSISVEEVIAIHSARGYLVSMIGSPGFIYLAGLDPRLAVPRRDRPRRVVDGGTVGIAGSQTGIYGRPRPGGWRLIATVDDVPDCAPGDRVTFVPVAGPVDGG